MRGCYRVRARRRRAWAQHSDAASSAVVVRTDTTQIHTGIGRRSRKRYQAGTLRWSGCMARRADMKLTPNQGHLNIQHTEIICEWSLRASKELNHPTNIRRQRTFSIIKSIPHKYKQDSIFRSHYDPESFKIIDCKNAQVFLVETIGSRNQNDTRSL